MSLFLTWWVTQWFVLGELPIIWKIWASGGFSPPNRHWHQQLPTRSWQIFKSLQKNRKNMNNAVRFFKIKVWYKKFLRTQLNSSLIILSSNINKWEVASPMSVSFIFFLKIYWSIQSPNLGTTGLANFYNFSEFSEYTTLYI